MPGVVVPVTVDAVASVPPERAFDVIAPIDLRRIFTGYGPLPAVAGVRDQTGPWDRAGASRVVELADGSTAREQLTVHERPHHFAYRVGPFTNALRALVHDVDGTWWFTAGVSGATSVRWTYAFRPRRGAAPLVRLLVAPLWRRYARRVLALAVREAERGG